MSEHGANNRVLQWLRNFAKSDSSKVVIGNVVGQLALLASLPVITRAYGPEAFGVYGTAMALALILQPVLTLRVEHVIPAYADLAEAKKRTRLANIVTSGVCGAVLAGALLIPQTCDALPELALLLWAYSWISVDNAMLIRQGRLRLLAWRNALGGLIAMLLQLLGAAVAPSSIVLAGGFAFGRLASVLITTRPIGRPESGRSMPEHRDRRRTLHAVISGVVSNTSTQMLVVATNLTYGSAPAGQAAAAQRAAGAPSTFMGQAMAQLVMARVSDSVRQGAEVTPVLRSMFLKLSVLAAAVGVGLLTLGPIVIPIFLGDGWELAGSLTAIFAIPFAMQFVTVPALPVFSVLRQEGLLLRTQLIRVAAVGAGAVTGYLVDGGVLFLGVLVALAMTLTYLYMLIVLWRCAKKFDARREGESGG
ncbi:hypothetical protein GCM10028820_14070 [Tessaracoccus terricola]